MSISIVVAAGMPYAGANFVAQAIATLPNVLFAGEAFHPDPSRRFGAHVMCWKTGQCCRRWCHDNSQSSKILALQLNAGHLMPADTIDVLKVGHTIVCVRHPLACYVAEVREGTRCERVTASPDRFADYLERYSAFYKRCESLYWRVKYVDRVHDPIAACRQLAQWLGTAVPAVPFVSPNEAPLPERVINWVEAVAMVPRDTFSHLEEW